MPILKKFQLLLTNKFNKMHSIKNKNIQKMNSDQEK